MTVWPTGPMPPAREHRYDPFNMLWQATRPGTSQGHTFVYGLGDERLWAIAWPQGSNTQVWTETWTLRDLGGSPLRQFRSEGGNLSGHWSLFADYIHRGGALLAAETEQGQRHVHIDHLGTPRLVTDAAGTTQAYHGYFPFGEEATSPTDSSIPLLYTGHERDDLEAGAGFLGDLDYMHARFFSAHVGRFMSPDPINSGRPRIPQSWNKYGYGRSNPLKFADPDGRTVVGFTGLGNSPGGITKAIEVLQGFRSTVGAARVFRHQDSLEGTAFLLEERKRDPTQFNALIGHSLGAYAALSAARRLDLIGGGVSVDLLVTVDAAPNSPGRTTVPPNVSLAINFFQMGADLGGTRLVAEDPSKTRVLNIELRSVRHTDIDEAVAGSIISEILNRAAEQGAELELEEGLHLIQGELIYIRE